MRERLRQVIDVGDKAVLDRLVKGLPEEDPAAQKLLDERRAGYRGATVDVVRGKELFTAPGKFFSLVEFIAFFGPLIGIITGFDAINQNIQMFKYLVADSKKKVGCAEGPMNELLQQRALIPDIDIIESPRISKL